MINGDTKINNFWNHFDGLWNANAKLKNFWPLVSFRDEDSNEKVVKATGLISKTRTLHVHYAFWLCTFLCRHCMTTTWKCLISRFIEEVHKRQRNSISLSELGYGSSEFNFRGSYLHLTKLVTLRNRDEGYIKRTRIHFFSDVFAAVLVLGS